MVVLGRMFEYGGIRKYKGELGLGLRVYIVTWDRGGRRRRRRRRGEGTSLRCSGTEISFCTSLTNAFFSTRVNG